ncbi:MAG: hypothetical protein ACKV22_05545 [Bryobacteraceae bacterium]
MWLRRLKKIVWGLLKELSDESAYERHLLARGCAPSAEEWRRFSERRLRQKYQQAKCC